MALIGKIAIAMAVNTKNFEKGLNTAASRLDAFGKQSLGTSKIVGGLLATALTGAAVYGLGKMTSMASDLGENMNKLGAIFGDDAKYIADQANLMADAFGVSKIQFTDAAARIGGLFKGVGYAAADASKLSVAMVQLANDSSSFYNVDFETAFDKIRSGLSGESEPLKDFGVIMSEAAIKAYAYSHGLARVGTELSEGAKVQARLGFITEKLADAQGDAAKTADGMANSTRGLWGRLENLATTIGTQLIPVAETFLADFQVGVVALGNLWADNQAAVTEWGRSTLGAIGQNARGMGMLQVAVGGIADTYHYLKIVWTSVVKDFLEGVSRIVRGLGQMYAFVNPLGVAMETLGVTAKTDFGAMADQIKALGAEWDKSFVRAMEAPLPSQKINKFFDEARDKIQGARKELAKTAIDVTKFTPAPAAGVAKAKGDKFASAMTAGSREANNTILRSRYGAGTAKGPADQTAKNTAATAAKIDRTNVILAGMAVRLGMQAGNALAGALGANL